MRRAPSAALLAAAAAALVLAVAAPAAAHNYVVESTPAEGEVLTTLPAEWQLVTNDTLLYVGNDAVFGLWVRDADGLFYGDGCLDVSGRAMSTPAAIGAAGDYDLVYQLVSADGHPLTGEIPFEWAPTDDVEPAIGSAEPTRCGTDPAPAPAETDDAAPPPASGESGDVVWVVAAVGAVGLAVVVAVLLGRRRPSAT